MKKDKEDQAIRWIRAFEPEDGYYLAYSGGKDSDVIRILANLAGVKHEIHHNHTTVDAPETVRYVRSIPGVIVDMPEKSMWQLIVDKGMPPTRIVRYCCSVLKERGGIHRVVMTGVRWSESTNRKRNGGLVQAIGAPKGTQKIAEEVGADAIITEKGGLILNDDNDEARRFVERCHRTAKTMVNPIIDWDEGDVYDFLRHYGCESNPLYQCGYRRVGCIGCPMSRRKGRAREFARYPKYQENYIRSFDRMIERRREKGKEPLRTMKTGEEVFRWWMEEDPNQLSMFDQEEVEEVLEEI